MLVQPWRIWPDCWSNDASTGSAEIRPTVGFFGLPSRWIRLATSYSRNSSLSGWKNAMTSRPSVEFVPARPKYRLSLRAPTGTACRPNSPARSSSSENGFGSIDGELELALRALRHLLQQLAHALRIGAQLRRLGARVLREEEVEVDRLLERADDALRAGRDRVQVALGQVDARAAQHERDEDRQSDEQHGERHERAGAVGPAGGSHVADGHVSPPSSGRARPRWPSARRRSRWRSTAGRGCRSRPWRWSRSA